MSDDLLDDGFFAPENETTASIEAQDAWQILIVDDEPAIHEVTTIALSGFTYRNRPLAFMHAYSAADAKALLASEQNQFAAALIDVVMETDQAGLDLVDWVRNEQKNELIRLILRTGQPGQAPERKVISDYDINDYKAKTELTSQKLFTLMYTTLRSYELIARLDASKRGVERVITATREIMQHRGFIAFVDASLEQLSLLLGVQNTVLMRQPRVAMEYRDDGFELLSCSGPLCEKLQATSKISDMPFAALAEEAIETGGSVYREHEILALIQDDDHRILFYLTDVPNTDELDRRLVALFIENVSIALRNLHSQLALTESQHEIIHRLTETVEKHSQETGHHVRRVSEGCAILGKHYGLSNDDVELLRLAAPLHDIGKVAIPDEVLKKPGKLNDDEWQIMKTHAERGYEILASSSQPLLKAGAEISRYHHEKWNGQGYPLGLKGEEIPIFARICSIIDVFDALLSKRVYKDAWSLDDVLALLNEEKGKSFEPKLVELVEEHLDKLLELRQHYPD
ncbi:HD domain-containing phosphohydrolase [Salinibius halmophilus]|uniref:HD domain-containing phosphohydrolase n=1 Tax=Salinibius halmophilus TaxID=1853216 RepID=UPI000E6742D5|nr:HD domain-containing phosphohydrolase [Salinibius halmophilus]